MGCLLSCLRALLGSRNKESTSYVPDETTISKLITKLEKEELIHQILKDNILKALNAFGDNIKESKNSEETSDLRNLIGQAIRILKKLKKNNFTVNVEQTKTKSIQEIKDHLLLIAEQMRDISKIKQNDIRDKLQIAVAYIQKLQKNRCKAARLQQDEKIKIAVLVLQLYVHCPPLMDTTTISNDSKNKSEKKEICDKQKLSTNSNIKNQNKARHKNKSTTELTSHNSEINIRLGKKDVDEQDIECKRRNKSYLELQYVQGEKTPLLNINRQNTDDSNNSDNRRDGLLENEENGKVNFIETLDSYSEKIDTVDPSECNTNETLECEMKQNIELNENRRVVSASPTCLENDNNPINDSQVDTVDEIEIRNNDSFAVDREHNSLTTENNSICSKFDLETFSAPDEKIPLVNLNNYNKRDEGHDQEDCLLVNDEKRFNCTEREIGTMELYLEKNNMTAEERNSYKTYETMLISDNTESKRTLNYEKNEEDSNIELQVDNVDESKEEADGNINSKTDLMKENTKINFGLFDPPESDKKQLEHEISDRVPPKIQCQIEQLFQICDNEEEPTFDKNLEVSRQFSSVQSQSRVKRSALLDEVKTSFDNQMQQSKEEDEKKILISSEEKLVKFGTVNIETYTDLDKINTTDNHQPLHIDMSSINSTKLMRIGSKRVKPVSTAEEIPTKKQQVEDGCFEEISSQNRNEELNNKARIKQYEDDLEGLREELINLSNVVETLEISSEEAYTSAVEKNISDLIEIRIRNISEEFPEVVEGKISLHNDAVTLKEKLENFKEKKTFHSQMCLMDECETEIMQLVHSRRSLKDKMANFYAARSKIHQIDGISSEIDTRKTIILNRLEGTFLVELANYLRHLSETINTEILNAEQFPFPKRINNYDARCKQIQTLRVSLGELPQEYPCMYTIIQGMEKKLDNVLNILDHVSTYNENVFRKVESLEKAKNTISKIQTESNIDVITRLQTLNKCRKDISYFDENYHQKIQQKKKEICHLMHTVETDIFNTYFPALEDIKSKLNKLEVDIYNFDCPISVCDYEQKRDEIQEISENVTTSDTINCATVTQPASVILEYLEKIFAQSVHFNQLQKRLDEIAEKISNDNNNLAEIQKQHLEEDQIFLHSIKMSSRNSLIFNKVKDLENKTLITKSKIDLLQKTTELNHFKEHILRSNSCDEFIKNVDQLLSWKQHVDEMPRGDVELDLQKKDFVGEVCVCLASLDDFVAKLVANQKQSETILELHSYFDFKMMESSQVSINTVEFVRNIYKKAQSFEESVEYYLGTNYSIDYYIIHKNLLWSLQQLHKVECDDEDEDLLTELIEAMDFVKGLIRLLSVNAAHG